MPYFKSFNDDLILLNMANSGFSLKCDFCLNHKVHLMFFKNKKVVFLGKWDVKDPLYRIYFYTLSSALKQSGVDVLIQGQDFEHISDLGHHHNLIINFFYKDCDSVEAVETIQQNTSVVVCFGSDIFNFSEYANACRVADVFVCPSNIHKLILKTTLNKPIEVLAEAVDPFITKFTVTPSFESRRLVWFGFPENYHKSMLTIAPVIQVAIKSRWIDSFTVISLPSLKEHLSNDFSFIPYDEKTIAITLRDYDYSLLSHFPLDGDINTYIKSPNKAIYSIMSGLIPICSSTPNYQENLSKMNLDKFLFGSPGELMDLLFELQNHNANYLKNIWMNAYQYSNTNFSEVEQLKQYCEILEGFQKQENSNRNAHSFPVQIFSKPEEVIKFRFYWRQKKKRIINYLRKLF